MSDYLDLPNPWVHQENGNVNIILQRILRKLSKVTNHKRRRRLEEVKLAVAYLVTRISYDGLCCFFIKSYELVFDAITMITISLDALMIDELDILPICNGFNDAIEEFLEYIKQALKNKKFLSVVHKLYEFYLDFIIEGSNQWTYALVGSGPMEVILSAVNDCTNPSDFDKFFDSKMLSIPDIIVSCGDYKYQHSLMILLLTWVQHIPPDLKDKFQNSCFQEVDQTSRENLLKDFTKTDLDHKSRNFLNALNAKSPVRVCSLPCLAFFVDHQRVMPPKHDTIDLYWVDFSSSSKRIHCFCSFPNYDWFSVSIHLSQIESLCFTWNQNKKDDDASQCPRNFTFSDVLPSQKLTSGSNFDFCFVHLTLKEPFDAICQRPDINVTGRSVYLAFNNPGGVEEALEMLPIRRHERGGKSCSPPCQMKKVFLREENIEFTRLIDHSSSQIKDVPLSRDNDLEPMSELTEESESLLRTSTFQLENSEPAELMDVRDITLSQLKKLPVSNTSGMLDSASQVSHINQLRPEHSERASEDMFEVVDEDLEELPIRCELQPEENIAITNLYDQCNNISPNELTEESMSLLRNSNFELENSESAELMDVQDITLSDSVSLVSCISQLRPEHNSERAGEDLFEDLEISPIRHELQPGKDIAFTNHYDQWDIASSNVLTEESVSLLEKSTFLLENSEPAELVVQDITLSQLRKLPMSNINGVLDSASQVSRTSQLRPEHNNGREGEDMFEVDEDLGILPIPHECQAEENISFTNQYEQCDIDSDIDSPELMEENESPIRKSNFRLENSEPAELMDARDITLSQLRKLPLSNTSRMLDSFSQVSHISHLQSEHINERAGEDMFEVVHEDLNILPIPEFQPEENIAFTRLFDYWCSQINDVPLSRDNDLESMCQLTEESESLLRTSTFQRENSEPVELMDVQDITLSQLRKLPASNTSRMLDSSSQVSHINQLRPEHSERAGEDVFEVADEDLEELPIRHELESEENIAFTNQYDQCDIASPNELTEESVSLVRKSTVLFENPEPANIPVYRFFKSRNIRHIPQKENGKKSKHQKVSVLPPIREVVVPKVRRIPCYRKYTASPPSSKGDPYLLIC